MQKRIGRKEEREDLRPLTFLGSHSTEGNIIIWYLFFVLKSFAFILAKPLRDNV